MDIYQRVVFTAQKPDNSSLFVTRDKGICRYLLKHSAQWNPLNEVYLLSKFVSSFSMTGDTDFQTGHFANLEQFKIGSNFADFRQVKTDPTYLLLLL